MSVGKALHARGPATETALTATQRRVRRTAKLQRVRLIGVDRGARSLLLVIAGAAGVPPCRRRTERLITDNTRQHALIFPPA